MDNVIQGAGSSGSFPLPTTAFSKMQVLHVLLILHSCCFWQAPRRLMALRLEFDVKEGQAVCEQVLPHSILYHWYFNVFHAKAA